jgi:hypothetical protein
MQNLPRLLLKSVVVTQICIVAASVSAATYEVGTGQTYTTLNSLPALNPGDIVEINPGTYKETKRWTNAGTAANPIIIRGIGSPPPVIDATGQTVDGVLPNPRAVFQVEASYVTIQNVELINARNGNNGAGIRVTTFGSTTVGVILRNCKCDNNDMGVMCDGSDNLLLDSCEISFNGTPLYDGYSHNLYLGGNKTTLQYCYIHDSQNGQNFKTRGHYTELFYNFIADSQDGELGLVDETVTATANSNAVMIGNIVVSKPRLSGYNSGRFIQFGQDSGGAHTGTLYAANNTFVAGDSRINFLDCNATGAAIIATNNIFYNSLSLSTGSPAISGSNNWAQTGSTVLAGFSGTVTGADPLFVNASTRNFHLTSASPCQDIAATAPTYLDGTGASHSAVPTQEYVQQLLSTPRVADAKLDDGAYEYSPANAAPQLLSGPLATPNPAQTGQAVTFSASAVDVDGDTLTYSWNFGDSGTGNGSSTTHTYSVAGTFSVSVTVSDPGGLTATGTVSVTISGSSGGTGGGGGGGGGSSGTGGGGGSGSGTTVSFTLKKLMANAKFKTGGSDSCSISGILPGLPAGFSPANQTLALNAGGATASFTLDAKGRAKSTQGNASLKLKFVRNKTTKQLTFNGGDVPFTAKLQKGTWSTVWNMDPNTSSSKVSTPMVISVQLAGVTYQITANVFYTVKAHVGGKIKN